MGGCQIFFTIIICVAIGIALGVWISDEYHIDGLKDLGTKLSEIFSKTAKAAQNSINDKLVNLKNNQSQSPFN